MAAAEHMATTIPAPEWWTGHEDELHPTFYSTTVHQR